MSSRWLAELWIPVDARLPENLENVLVNYEVLINDKLVNVVWIGYYNIRDSVWCVDGLAYTVTAWMPLPNPYVKGEQYEI